MAESNTTVEKIVKPQYAPQPAPQVASPVPVKTEEKTEQSPVESFEALEEQYQKELGKTLKIEDGKKWVWNWGDDPTQHPLFSTVANALGMTRGEAMRFDTNIIADLGKRVIETVGDNDTKVYQYIHSLMKLLPHFGNPAINLHRYLLTRGGEKYGLFR